MRLRPVGAWISFGFHTQACGLGCRRAACWAAVTARLDAFHVPYELRTSWQFSRGSPSANHSHPADRCIDGDKRGLRDEAVVAAPDGGATAGDVERRQ